MPTPYILFFDTFNHDEVSSFNAEREQIKTNMETFDCVRFKSPINLLEVRIIPFGLVVESNLSDEAILGATNPAMFEIVVYSNNQANCITLHNIARYHFDEKLGINSFTFKEPVHSNFLLFRGLYTTMTVALFGIPALPLSAHCLLPGGAGIHVPPPTAHSVGQIVPPTAIGLFQHTTAKSKNSPTISPVRSSNLTALVMHAQIKESQWPEGRSAEQNEEASREHTQPNDGVCLSQIQQHESTNIGVPKVEVLTNEDTLPSVSDLPGLYEDGEIQDIDYEEISSNEEIFSEPENGTLDENALFSESDPRFASCFWRFNPWEMANSGCTGSHTRRKRLPDPTSTLFQLHTWLLNQPIADEFLRHTGCSTLDKTDTESAGDEKPEGSSVGEQSHPQEQKDCHESTIDVTTGSSGDFSGYAAAPPSDWTLAAEAGEWLLALAGRFNVDADLHDEWVEEMEGIEANLALGLAFLSMFRGEETFKNVSLCLLHWVRVGLDVNQALRQPNATYIVRHITAGVRLAGLLVGTTSPALAHAIIRPECQVDGQRRAGGDQVQQLLLDLLESPLVGTPLRLTICRALDQTTRLPMGLDAFLGRACSEPVDVCPGHVSTAVTEAMAVSPSAEKDLGRDEADGRSPLGEVNKGTGKTVDDVQTEGKRTPYQRLICLFAASKNSRVTTAYQRLVNKAHAYEMLLDFQEFMLRLRLYTSPTVEGQEALEARLVAFLRELTRLWIEAPEAVADSRNSLPCSILLDRSQSSNNDPYPAICCLFDRINLLDSLAWLTEQLPRRKLHPPTLGSKTMETDTRAEEDEAVKDDNNSRQASWLSADLVAPSLTRFIGLLLTSPTGLGFLASREEATSRLLSACLSLEDTAQSPALVELAVCGLEMACKLDVYNSLDLLVAWARKEGVSGVSTTIARLTGERSGEAGQTESGEAVLRGALFSLARMCVCGLGCPLANSGSGAGDSRLLTSVLTSSLPVWLAEVLVMDDFLAPLLMIVEALAAGGKETSLSDTALALNRSSEALKEAKAEANRESGTMGSSSLPAATSIRSTLKSLLQSPLDPVGLVNIIMTTVLRFSENMQYLDRYAPRLVQLVSAYSWEDCVEDSATVGFFSQLASFSEAASPFLGWLRDFPEQLTSRLGQQPSSSLLSLLQPAVQQQQQRTSTDRHMSLLSSDAVPWLVGQLPAMCRQMEEALEAMFDMDISEELAAGGERRSASGQAVTAGSAGHGITVGQSLPPCILLLLRLLRSHLMPDSEVDKSELSSGYGQVFLADSLAVIELYKANGLLLLSSLIQRLSDFLVLHYQVSATTLSSPITCGSSNCCCSSQLSSSICHHQHLDPAHVTNNGVGGLVVAMLDQATQLVGVLLHAILVPAGQQAASPTSAAGSQFRDVTVARSLFKAYACTVYAQVSAGPHRSQVDRLRRSTINALMAYVNAGIGQSLAPKDVEASLWVEVLRELVAFTVSSPVYYLPGLCIFLDLLPLPLPVVTVSPIDSASQQKLLAHRSLWAVHLLPVASELAGLIELLVATSLSPPIAKPSSPSLCHPVYAALLRLVIRLGDLSGCASLLAEACLATVFAVCDDIYARVNKKTVIATLDKEDTKTMEQASCLDSQRTLGQQPQPTGSCLSIGSTGGVGAGTGLGGSTASVRLLLLQPPSACDGGQEEEEEEVSDSVGAAVPPRSELEEATSDGDKQKTKQQQQQKKKKWSCDLTSLSPSESVELAATLALLRLHLQSPVCRLAIIGLLSSSSTATSTSTGPTDDQAGSKDQLLPGASLRGRQKKLCAILSDILSVLCDQPAIVQLQLIVLECISLLLDSRRALLEEQPPEETDTLKRLLVKGLPDMELCRELVAALIRHIDHPDRDMATLPAALQPLLVLTEQDIGFHLVVEALQRSTLVAPSGTSASGQQHFFASLLQRVNDCFSVENPACQTTLAMCLRLLQSLLLLHPTAMSSSSSSTVATAAGGDQLPGDQFSSPLSSLSLVPDDDDLLFDAKVLLRLRQHRLTVCSLRPFMGWWSTVGDEGKPVRDLHALLEMLADDEPSLEYLRTGMKNLLTLLSTDFDAPQSGVEHLEKQLSVSTKAINELVAAAKPECQTTDEAVKNRKDVLLLAHLAPNEKRRLTQTTRLRLRVAGVYALNETLHRRKRSIAWVSPDQPVRKPITCDLGELARVCCKGMSIRDELVKCGRQQDQAEVAIRHQKRRRGQSTIIETGRNAKKFVAPMRGRGFVLRATGMRGHGGQTGATGGGGGGVASATGGMGSASAAGGGGGGANRLDLFRNRPLNTSRPPSLHVDDFTKLVKDDNIEELPRSRLYRDGRGFRGGRSAKPGGNRSAGVRAPPSLSGSVAAASGAGAVIPAAAAGVAGGPIPAAAAVQFGLATNPIGQLGGTGVGNPSLLPIGWPSLGRPLFPFDMDSRSGQTRRERTTR